MRSAIGTILTAVSERIAARRRMSDFNCGDCERSNRCGRPPNESCIHRLEQIERGDWKARRHARAVAETMTAPWA